MDDLCCGIMMTGEHRILLKRKKTMKTTKRNFYIAANSSIREQKRCTKSKCIREAFSTPNLTRTTLLTNRAVPLRQSYLRPFQRFVCTYIGT